MAETTKTMKDFLNSYFRQLHFDSMPPAVRARFDEYVNHDDLIGDMKSWRDELLDKDEDGKLYKDDTGHYAHKPLPDAKTELSDSEWEKFYSALQHALISMNMDRGSLDKDTKDFLDKYFGKGKVFESMPLDDVAKNAVDDFREQILDDDNGYSLFNAYAGVEDATKADFEEFKEAVRKGEYKDKAEVRKKLIKMLRNLQNVDLTEYQGFKTVGNKLNALALSGKLTRVLNGLSQEKEPTTADINKLKSRYAEILTTLHNDKKIAEDFKRFDNGKISGQLEAAIAKTDYTGEITKKDFVPEKQEDRKTLGQRIQNTAQDFYDNNLKRWVTLHRDHVYVKGDNDPAKPIVDVMTGKEFNLKPTDGIQAMIDKADAIAAKVKEKSPKAAEHFEWFSKTMKSLSKLSCFKSALRNGKEMHTLIRNVWDRAVEENKLDEAETAMQVLDVMSYGLFDSRTMNAINSSEKTSFLGDKNLSWNKNPIIGNITDKIDKVGGFLFRTTAKAAVGGINMLRRIGTKTNEADEDKYLKSGKADEAIIKKNNEDRAAIKKAEAELAGLAEGSEERQAKEEEIKKLQDSITKRSEKLNNETKNFDFQNAKDMEALDKAKEKQQGLDKDSEEYKAIQDEIDFYNSSIEGRTKDFNEQDKKKKEAYARLMGFWKLLKTGKTKYMLFFRGKMKVKNMQENLQEKKNYYLDQVSSRAA